ncbi:hypothetical protein OIU34_20090 [Pararhizobium sp. BT-229]|uniref:hypothetical protein n=1 Tax=Pararhizobium sp. BT-229 TaxID=2986923 RepID=UPI0021F6F470|nr:hypothetical protein [Pararhizobium sp. BT-229]MCV9964188.1 hypothetical protein [Pararhizobium sp. BT-229]
MTLRTIAENITGFAGEELARLGLTVVPAPSQDESTEDHSIEFRDGNDREHAVSVQVNSYAPSWSNVSLTIRHVEMKPIDGTRYSCASLGWVFSELRSNSRTGRIEEIMTAIKAHNWFMPVDDLDAGILTDFRMEKVIPKLREHFFDGEVRLSRSGANTAVDTVEILDNDGEVAAKAVFEAPATIRVIYATLAGDERVLAYNGMAAFEERIDRDLGGTPARTAGPRV